MKRIFCRIIAPTLVVVLCIVSYMLCMRQIDELFSDGDETLTNSESSYVVRKGHLDNPLPCDIVETYECRIGFVIPQWVPYIGGVECVFEYVDEVLFPGTQNLCIYTANDNQSCFYFQCKKNGT